VALSAPASVRYSLDVRLTVHQRLLAAVLAIWMPLSCCCQAMALARAAVAAVTPAADADACETRSCCSAREAEPQGGTTDRSQDDERSPAPCDECPACAAAKGKAPPPNAPDIDHDTVGRDIAWLPAAGEDGDDRGSTAAAHDRGGTDPPWRPSGRTALARHARLVI
jgi:hypothetical protein